MDARPDADPRSSLSRGLSLLDLFEERDLELSVREMARRSGIPKSTAHRLVGDLVAWGALERGERGLRLGGRLVALVHEPAPAPLRELVLPYARALQRSTGLTPAVAIRTGRKPSGAPMHTTALGKAILAFSDPEYVDAVLEGPLVALTGRTLIDPEQLRRELSRIRELHVAYESEEARAGCFAVAAPFFDRTGALAGGIAVTGATNPLHVQRSVPSVRRAAAAIGRALQSTASPQRTVA